MSVRTIPAGKTVRLTGPVVVSTILLESAALTVRFTVPATVGGFGKMLDIVVRLNHESSKAISQRFQK